MIMNRQIHAKKAVRTLSSNNIASDHGLFLAQRNLEIKIAKSNELQVTEEKLHIESMQNEGTNMLYQYRLRDKHDIQIDRNIETI